MSIVALSDYTFHLHVLMSIALLEMSIIFITRSTAAMRALLLPPTKGFSLRPRFLLPGKKRAFYALLAYFRTFLVFSSNLSNF